MLFLDDLLQMNLPVYWEHFQNLFQFDAVAARELLHLHIQRLAVITRSGHNPPLICSIGGVVQKFFVDNYYHYYSD